MSSDTLSGKADADIENIASSSIQTWGLARAEAYIVGLHETFARLAEFPDLGRGASHIRPGYRRIEAASHSVFYLKSDASILIVRVLHQRMDVDQYL